MEWLHDAVSDFSNSIFIALIKDDNYKRMIDGLGRSVLLTLISAVIGIAIGVLIAIVKLQPDHSLYGTRLTNGLRRWSKGFADGYLSLVRGTPALVQLTVIYFVIFGKFFKDSSLEAYQIAAIAFGINSGAYVAEIIRAGIMAIDKGQSEAARSLGLSGAVTMRYVVMPQAIKNVLPALANEFIVLLKETSVAGYIGIMDMTKAAQGIGAVAYDYMVPLLCAAFLYWLMVTFMTAGVNRLERRMRRSD